MKRVPMRVEPFSTYLERRRTGPIFPVIVAGETVYVSGLPPFDPDTDTGEIKRPPFERQADIVLNQMKRCVEAAGSSLERVVMCNVIAPPMSLTLESSTNSTRDTFPWNLRRASS